MWWIWASISGGAGLLVLITCICCCCCIRNKMKKEKEKDTTYNRVPDEEIGSELEELTDSFDSRHSQKQKKRHPRSQKRDSSGKGDPLTYYVSAPHHRAVDRVAQYHESGAESSLSDYDRASESVSISAYGDAVSTHSSDSYGTNSFAKAPGNLAIQASLIYSRDSKYVAGKIVTIDGLRFDKSTMKPMIEIKCHVVILPLKKYALKTNWYHIQKNRIKMDEYFKFKFKQLPQETKTMLRFRLYGRRATVGRSHCLGECYVGLREIITSRGGLTLWRSITKGAPEIVDLE
ncbi:uncharacterized protein [Clytia hemisphaerica]|uniref:Uncharacterized protein n=1 Tax=Clytia hemisphaerica TaxID=252671 RepID=A0A7M5XMD3_9CNID